MATYSATKAKIRLWLTPLKYRLDGNSKYAFIGKLNAIGQEILDVGCGVDSVRKLKTQAPLAEFDGIDIEEYQMSSEGIQSMRTYWIVEKEKFAHAIATLPKNYDGIILSHVIEHLEAPEAFLEMLLSKLKPGGMLYISTPCMESVYFPKIHKGCLNFYDDETHVSPVNIIDWGARLGSEFAVHKCVKRNRGNMMLTILGWFSLPFVWFGKRYTPFIWYYYGFESVIWVKKLN